VQSAWSKTFTDNQGALLTAPLSVNKKKDLHARLKELITRRFPRYHWLAPLPKTTSPLILDFQLIQTVALPHLEGIEVIAALQSPFREEVPARYAAYMSRVGVPDFEAEQIEAWAEEAEATIFPPKDTA
jgi:hypothetical protein